MASRYKVDRTGSRCRDLDSGVYAKMAKCEVKRGIEWLKKMNKRLPIAGVTKSKRSVRNRQSDTAAPATFGVERA